MSIFPQISQYQSWTLPSKYAFWGLWISVIALILGLFQFLSPANPDNPANPDSLVIFAVEQIEMKSIRPKESHSIEYPFIKPNSTNYLKQIIKINRDMSVFAKRLAIDNEHYDIFSTTYDIQYNQNQILCIVFDLYFGMEWANHGVSMQLPYSINLSTGAHFELKDLFRANYHNFLNEIIVRKLKENGTFYKCDKQKLSKQNQEELRKYTFLWTGSSYMADLPGCFTGVEDNQSFIVTESGIKLIYSEYEIGPYAVGAISVDIAFNELYEIHNPNGPLAIFY